VVAGTLHRSLFTCDQEGDIMDAQEMERLFRTHREAEVRRDYDAIMDTFTADCYLETIALGTRSQGREAARAAYVGYFTAFPDLTPDDQGMAFGDHAVVAWGLLRGTSGGEWLSVAPSGRSFAVPFTNVARFEGDLMAGESIYFDLATLCEQAALPLDEIRAAARARAEAVRRTS
jgi:predicted ester cyclase